MPITREFKQEQRSVALAMITALAVTIIVLGVVAMVTRTQASFSFIARLQFTLRVDLILSAWLVAAIGNVARLRFFSERDIAGSSADAGSIEVRVASAILQNTLEQTYLAVVTQLIVTATFDKSDALVFALSSLFAIGRTLFWTHYKRGAKGRAFGFALTFYPSVVALLASAIWTVFEWTG